MHLWMDGSTTIYDIGEATNLWKTKEFYGKPRNFVTFQFFDGMLFGRVVVKFGIDFASIFSPKTDQKSIQN